MNENIISQTCSKVLNAKHRTGQSSIRVGFHSPENLDEQGAAFDFSINCLGVWWTCLLLHAILVTFYFVWFLVGVTVALWVEIPTGSFGSIVQYAFGPVTLFGGMVHHRLSYLAHN
jgi:hypothetical protein